MDRDLLEALFAQQLGLAPAQDIMAAGAEWLVQRERGTSLKAVLLARGVIDAPRARLIDALVDEAIAQHGGSPREALDSLPAEAQRSLDGLTATLRSGEHSLPADAASPERTVSFDSLETPDHVSVEVRGRYTFDTGRKGRTQELGRGGAGRVLVARDHLLGRDVAMKELHRDVTQNDRFDTVYVSNLEARFLREARVTGQLEHPAIVPVYELGRRRDGTLYYTMRRVRGRTLAQALADTLTLEGRLAFVPDLLMACQAVAAAHHRGVIHRDLKPQNVMLGPHGETYVMDWGLARVMGRADRQRHAVQLAPDLTGGRLLGPVGTPSYMSPEQADGHRDDIDERSDVWGLGAMLFEVLTGRAPYVGRSPWDVLAEVRSAAPPRVASLAPTAPPELVAVCEKALRRDREGRYRDAGALAADLEAWLTGGRVSAYQYRPVDVGRRILSRHRGTAALLAAGLVLLLGLLALAGARIDRERDEARSMARFFLADVAPTLSHVPGTGQLLEQLSSSALEAFSAGVDPERGRREDRLLLARAWNGVGYQNWRLGRFDASREALAAARRFLAPLRTQFPTDAEGVAAELEADVLEADLEATGAADEGWVERFEALASRARTLHELSPRTAYSLSVERLAADRAAISRVNAGDVRAGLEHARWAWAVAGEAYQANPEDAEVAAATVFQAQALGTLLVGLGERAEGLDTLRTAARRAERLRTTRDGRALREAHGAVLMELASVLDPGRERAEFQAAVREARRQMAELQRSDASNNSVMADVIILAILDGDFDAAQRAAEHLAGRSVGAEYDESIIMAAFAAGRDDVVRQHAAGGASGAPGQAALWAGVLEALAGRPALAREHFATCARLKCEQYANWQPSAVLHRVGARTDEAARLLSDLARAFPAATVDSRRFGAALAQLADDLGRLP